MTPTTNPIETWRNAPTCDEHEQYKNGCTICFGEAVEGGLGWLVDQMLPYTEARPMPAAGPGHAVFEIWFEDTRLFAVTYREGDALVVPDSAFARIEEIWRANEDNVAFWDAQISELELADAREGNPDLLHRAMQRRGVAGARLDRVKAWADPRSSAQAKSDGPKPGLTIPPGRRAV